MFHGPDVLAVLDDVLDVPRDIARDIARVRACLPPHVPIPKPGPCKGTKRASTAVKKTAKQTIAKGAGKATAGRRKAPRWTPESRRVPGRDVEADMRADYLSSIRDRKQTRTRLQPQVTALIEKQDGYGNPAQVVSAQQLDQAIDAGWTELWRGVRDHLAPAADIAEQERTGTWQASVGHYGGGIYYSPRRTTAENFRRDQTDAYTAQAGDASRWGPGPLYEWQGDHPPGASRGGLIRSALDPSARVADYDTLRREQFEWILEQTRQPWQIEQDLGFYAVMRGYDAVRVPTRSHRTDGAVYPAGVQDKSEAPQYLILNRSVLMTEEASDRHDT